MQVKIFREDQRYSLPHRKTKRIQIGRYLHSDIITDIEKGERFKKQTRESLEKCKYFK
jgi:hypothetical protein